MTPDDFKQAVKILVITTPVVGWPFAHGYLMKKRQEAEDKSRER